MIDPNVLLQFSDEELQLELERRELERVPKLIENPDFESLKILCLEYIDGIQNENLETDKEYIFEAALEAFFGENVFDWINDRI